MKKMAGLILGLLLAFLLVSCQAYKKVPYLQDTAFVNDTEQSVRQTAAFRQEYRQEADIHMNVNTCLFPDTLSTLTALKKQGARIGIISTKYRFRIVSFLEKYMPEDFLDIVVGGEDVKAAKPSPEGVRFALEHLGSAPQETLYIGDSTVDAETACNAGVDFAGVLNGMTTAEELQAYPHKIIMQNLGELVQ